MEFKRVVTNHSHYCNGTSVGTPPFKKGRGTNRWHKLSTGLGREKKKSFYFFLVKIQEIMHNIGKKKFHIRMTMICYVTDKNTEDFDITYTMQKVINNIY